MPEVSEGISRTLRFTAPKEVIEGRSFDAIEIRVEVVGPTGYYFGSDSLLFNPDTDQPNANPFPSWGAAG